MTDVRLLVGTVSKSSICLFFVCVCTQPLLCIILILTALPCDMDLLLACKGMYTRIVLCGFGYKNFSLYHMIMNKTKHNDVLSHILSSTAFTTFHNRAQYSHVISFCY